MIFKTLLFFILLSSNVISDNRDSKKYGSPLSQVKNELMNLSFHGIVNDGYSFSVDSVDKYDRKKRFLYWLNLRNSRLAKVKISNDEKIIMDKNKEREAVVHQRGQGSFTSRSVSHVNVQDHHRSFFEIRSLLSLNTIGGGLSTFSFQDLEQINFSEPDDSIFHAIFGIYKKTGKNHDLYFNLFVNRDHEKHIRLNEFSGIYKYQFFIDRNFILEPYITVFIPVKNRDYDYFDKEYQRGVVLSPSLNLRSYLLSYFDFSYHIGAYYNFEDSHRNTLQNTVKISNKFRHFGLAAGINSLNRKNYLKMTKFIALYHSHVTMLSKELKIAVSLNNDLFDFSDPRYTFGVSYNF